MVWLWPGGYDPLERILLQSRMRVRRPKNESWKPESALSKRKLSRDAWYGGILAFDTFGHSRCAVPPTGGGVLGRLPLDPVPEIRWPTLCLWRYTHP